MEIVQALPVQPLAESMPKDMNSDSECSLMRNRAAETGLLNVAAAKGNDVIVMKDVTFGVEVVVGKPNVHAEINKKAEKNKTNDKGTVGKGNAQADEHVKQGAANGMNKEMAWTALFKNNRAPNEGLNLHEVKNLDKSKPCRLGEKDVLTSKKAWGHTLIGYFAGRQPGKWSINQLTVGWGVKVRYFIHSSGWFVFKFEEELGMNKVLEGGPYFVWKQPLILKPIPPYFRFEDEEMRHMPVWVTLPCLPKEAWGLDALSMILSYVGKPLWTDRRTAMLDGFAYARALVEVDASSELIKEVPVILPHNENYVQQIIYDYYPTYCGLCKCIGHSEATCDKKTKKMNTMQNPAQTETTPKPSAMPKPTKVPNLPEPATITNNHPNTSHNLTPTLHFPIITPASTPHCPLKKNQ